MTKSPEFNQNHPAGFIKNISNICHRMTNLAKAYELNLLTQLIKYISNKNYDIPHG